MAFPDNWQMVIRSSIDTHQMFTSKLRWYTTPYDTISISLMDIHSIVRRYTSNVSFETPTCICQIPLTVFSYNQWMFVRQSVDTRQIFLSNLQHLYVRYFH